ncbi:trypsin-like peptidase domain-containing protein [Streptomyces sp. NPDC003023]|uniref:VMAP-C domain-containing protein n=1 Tax=Streptomyces sp. NPDC003023 TaxID=3364675 RepID=UPI003688B60E
MGWFHRRATPGSQTALLREGDSRAAGAAVLLSPSRLLTCAHVVNDAMGRQLLNAEQPDDDRAFSIAFYGAEAARGRGTARLSLWLPPQRRPDSIVWDGDLAVLDLEEPAPDWTRPVVWREMAEGMELRAWHGGGAGITYADTVAGYQDDGCCYLDGALTGAAIGPGYSGGPLWVRSDSTVAGLVVAQVMPDAAALRAQETVRRGWAVPWQTVRDELARAGAADVVDECEVVRRNGPIGSGANEASVQAVLPLLRTLLDDPVRRADHCRDLAAHLGCEPPSGGGAPTPSLEELAAVLLTEDRALATLSESLAPVAERDTFCRGALSRLLALGRIEGQVRLLSFTEHRQLLTALRAVVVADPGLIARAAREALRFLTLPAPLAHASRLTEADVDTVVLALEDYPDGRGGPARSTPVPALLRLAEFTAAATAGARSREELRSWCDRVARRLGISPSALGERRADAEAWAAHRPSAVARIVTRLAAAGPDRPGQFLCELWLSHKDGTRVSVAVPKEPLPPEEIGRLIRRTAEGSRVGDEPAPSQVDVVVGPADLELPVDGWETGNELGDILPELGELQNVFPDVTGLGMALGSRYQVALRCPELTGRIPTAAGEMRRRWAAEDPRALVVSEPSTDVHRLYELLKKEHHDTARVVLHGPPRQRAPLLPVCLAMGVPVVLWDRAAASHDDAARMDDLDPTGPLDKLPQRLQNFRSVVYGAGADPSAARPALVWHDAELPLPGPLHLADPP